MGHIWHFLLEQGLSKLCESMDVRGVKTPVFCQDYCFPCCYNPGSYMDGKLWVVSFPGVDKAFFLLVIEVLAKVDCCDMQANMYNCVPNLHMQLLQLHLEMG